MHTYEKHYTDSSGNYEIIQFRTDGTRRKVEDNHAGFLDWLEGNVLPEVAYVEPPEPGVQPPSLESRVQAVEDALLMLI